MAYRVMAAAVLAAAVVAAPIAEAQSQERCYGVALAGQDQGTAAGGKAGSSRVDYQGDAWVMVASGSCMTMPLPVQPDGTPRRGALDPLDRDRP